MSFVGLLGGLDVRVDALVPLTRRDENGVELPVLYWRVGDKLLVHPDNVERVNEFIRSAAGRGYADEEIEIRGPRKGTP